MPPTALASKFRLLLLAAISFLGLLPLSLLWLVNLDVAIRVHHPQWQGLSSQLPSQAYETLATYCDDLSTISTLIPLMLLLYPLILAIRVWRWGPQAPERLLHEIYDPYPPHFPFFLVMLGLAGTLYGLLIGLDVSGVSAIDAEALSPEQIQQTFNKLLGGTATALLSSLLGLAGAFLAARPLTWICHRAVNMPTPSQAISLEETFHELIQDMQALGHASKEFREQLGLTDLPALPRALDHLQSDLSHLRQDLADKSFEKSLVDLLNLMQQHQRDLSTQQTLQGTALLEKLSAIETQLSAQTTAQQKGTQLLHSIGEQLEQSRLKQEAAQSQAQDLRQQMLSHLEQQQQDRSGDRQAIRQAFGSFLDSRDEGTSA
ncbi:hypothetical protein P3T73_13505 [Kiritimatiellota bacterium B12222]|nr:hypothetical protein P3T73_13505 [Kiritimatiellota bacterium B12222]